MWLSQYYSRVCFGDRNTAPPHVANDTRHWQNSHRALIRCPFCRGTPYSHRIHIMFTAKRHKTPQNVYNKELIRHQQRLRPFVTCSYWRARRDTHIASSGGGFGCRRHQRIQGHTAARAHHVIDSHGTMCIFQASNLCLRIM